MEYWRPALCACVSQLVAIQKHKNAAGAWSFFNISNDLFASRKDMDNKSCII
jgi:hypothetical protein